MEFKRIATLIDTAEKAQHVANFFNSVECKVLCLSEAHKTAQVAIELNHETETVIFTRTIDGDLYQQDVTKQIGTQLSLSHDILEAPKPARTRRSRKSK